MRGEISTGENNAAANSSGENCAGLPWVNLVVRDTPDALDMDDIKRHRHPIGFNNKNFRLN
ncbi:MAG: hypothetical protein HON25_10415 [Gammaproteobacteria bacterium]|nr:hypothetical protein [Gammaproteobacteria bacterium]MBT5681232.1 hypothetical protein [Gammaproteobacteria bacterium]MBT6024293.1 hypothetical protein [Gammaproteobacteria bacterium]MBT6558803.1 hypothetical protein [Gammaproteobacteria bacterium]